MAEKIKKIVVPKNKKVSDFYLKTLESEHHLILEQKTVEFIDDFFDLYGQKGGKVLYYEALFLLKKGFYPRKYIYFVLHFSFKKVFKKHNLDQLKGFEEFFAKTTLNSAVAAYCKNKMYENSTYVQYYQPESFLKKIKRKIRQFFRNPSKRY